MPRYEAQHHNWLLIRRGIEMVVAEIHGHDFGKHDSMDLPIRSFIGVVGLPGYEFQNQLIRRAPTKAVTGDYDLNLALAGLVAMARLGGPIATFLKTNYRTLSADDVFGIDSLDLLHEEDRRIIREKQGFIDRCRKQMELVCRPDVADYLLRSHLFDKSAPEIADEDIGAYSSLSPLQQKAHEKLCDRINHKRAYWRPAEKRPLTEAALQAILPNLKWS